MLKEYAMQKGTTQSTLVWKYFSLKMNIIGKFKPITLYIYRQYKDCDLQIFLQRGKSGYKCPDPTRVRLCPSTTRQQKVDFLNTNQNN